MCSEWITRGTAGAPGSLPLRRREGRDRGRPCVWGRSVGGRSPGGSCSLPCLGGGVCTPGAPSPAVRAQLLVFRPCPHLFWEPALAQDSSYCPSSLERQVQPTRQRSPLGHLGCSRRVSPPAPFSEAPHSPTPFSDHSSGLAVASFSLLP